jgi:hypothetical protein
MADINGNEVAWTSVLNVFLERFGYGETGVGEPTTSPFERVWLPVDAGLGLNHPTTALCYNELPRDPTRAARVQLGTGTRVVCLDTEWTGPHVVLGVKFGNAPSSGADCVYITPGDMLEVPGGVDAMYVFAGDGWSVSTTGLEMRLGYVSFLSGRSLGGRPTLQPCHPKALICAHYVLSWYGAITPYVMVTNRVRALRVIGYADDGDVALVAAAWSANIRESVYVRGVNSAGPGVEFATTPVLSNALLNSRYHAFSHLEDSTIGHPAVCVISTEPGARTLEVVDILNSGATTLAQGVSFIVEALPASGALPREERGSHTYPIPLVSKVIAPMTASTLDIPVGGVTNLTWNVQYSAVAGAAVTLNVYVWDELTAAWQQVYTTVIGAGVAFYSLSLGPDSPLGILLPQRKVRITSSAPAAGVSANIVVNGR